MGYEELRQRLKWVDSPKIMSLGQSLHNSIQRIPPLIVSMFPNIQGLFWWEGLMLVGGVSNISMNGLTWNRKENLYRAYISSEP